MVGELQVGDNLAEWYGQCEPGYKLMNVNYEVGSAKITGEVCNRWSLSGESTGYGINITVNDQNPKLPVEKQGAFTFVGQEARSIFSQGTGHHGCWFEIDVKLPYVEYKTRNDSLPRDNVITETAIYKVFPAEKDKNPAEPFQGP